MSKLIQGTHHIALKCRDDAQYQKTIEFYGTVLGLDVVRTWGEGEKAGIMFDLNGSLLEIFASGGVECLGAIPHFALATADTDACAAAVQAAGYEVFLGPKDIVITSQPPFPARIAFCHGPVGEEIEFFQET